MKIQWKIPYRFYCLGQSDFMKINKFKKRKTSKSPFALTYFNVMENF